ncbi:MAG: hypothetical protein WCK77_21430 [Verrucomicrobiota bacterium]
MFVIIWQQRHYTKELSILKDDLFPAMPPNLDALGGHQPIRIRSSAASSSAFLNRTARPIL